MKLPLNFFTQKDTLELSKKLLGKYLFSKIDGKTCGGMIIETEAYLGKNDKASHAYKNKLTLRTKPLFERGGIAYVYFCYGMHYLLNIVTNIKNIPHAILIRAIMPTSGLDVMLKRRQKTKISFCLTSGPALLCQALGITKKQNMVKFTSSTLWIEDRNVQILEKDIIKSPRVGVAYAKEDALLPYRFRIKNNKWTSKAK